MFRTLRKVKVVVTLVALAGFIGFIYYDRLMNYEDVTATVTSVEVVCYLAKKEGKLKWSTTDKGPCDEVEEINRTHPDYLDYTLRRNTTVEYRYKSPVDGEFYTASHEQRKHKDGRIIARGDEIVILAHNTKAEKTRKY